MGFQDAIRSFFKRYTDFQGRSSRSEYWWVILAYLIVYLVLYIPMMMDPGGALGMVSALLLLVFALGILIPMIAVSIRRLHDQEKSGWWVLLSLVPLLNLILIVFYVLPGTKGPNKYGPDPLQSPSEAFA